METRSIDEIADNMTAMLRKTKKDVSAIHEKLQDICEDHDRLKRGDKMKMTDALEELKEMAGGGQCAVGYELLSNETSKPCNVWIFGEGSISAPTFRIALDRMREHMGLDPIEAQEIPDIEA